jgi:hypothetical protein
MAPRTLTKDVGNLRGFSTDSIFVRPSYVADVAVNINRYPDTTLGSRRGYQCKVAAIGGLGTGTYDNPEENLIETVTIDRNGQLYRLLHKQIYIYFTDPATAMPWGSAWTFMPWGSPSSGSGVGRYLTFTIFTDPRFLATLPWGSAWTFMPWGSPSGESITNNTWLNRAAQINGNQGPTNTLIVDAGHVLLPNDVIQFLNSNSVLVTASVASTTGTTITIAGPAVTVLDNAYINQYLDIPFRKGFDVGSPYPIRDFLAALSTLAGVQSSINGDDTYPAAFLDLVEPIQVASGGVLTLEYTYWEQVNKTIPITFPRMSIVTYQNSEEFENASFATFDDAVYIANGLDENKKYDGQTVYSVGMPKGIQPLATEVNLGAGKLANGTYNYAITYEQVDNIGHVAEGAISDNRQLVIASGPSNGSIVVTDLLANSGWNTDGALFLNPAVQATVYGPDVNGNYYHNFGVQNTPHTMEIGDTAYYQDTIIATKNGLSASAENVLVVDAGHGVEVNDVVVFLNTAGDVKSRTVTVVQPTSITVDGVPVIVADNATFATNKANKVFGNIAIVDGTQNNLTVLTVKSGHTVQVNDWASFTDAFDRVQRRLVEAVTATTITISGIPVTVNDLVLITTETIRTDSFSVIRKNATGLIPANAAPISNNLRINIWRTRQDGEQLFLLATIPNDSLNATQTYLDKIQASQTTGVITGATQANPAVITAPAHNLKTGMQLTIDDVLGMIQLNGRNYTITVVSADTYSLNGVNSTAYGAYTAGGKWTLIFSENDELGVPFPDPIRLPDPPPISKYVLTYGNQLLYAGGERNVAENSDNVFFSEGNQPEAVPRATNFFPVPAPDDDVSGLGVAGSTLVIFKKKSMDAVTGDLLTSQFQVIPIAPGTNIGCVANATIASVGTLLYFLSSNGVYALSENQLFPTDAFGNPVAISVAIENIFRENNFIPSYRYVMKRAVAVNYQKDNQYLLFLPCEDTTTTVRDANANSAIFCYDYQGKNWFQWKNMNAAGGLFVINDNLFFHERRFSGVVGNTSNLYRQHRFYRLIDYADHTGPIRTEWKSSWEDVGLPAVRKKFVRCMLYIDRVTDLQQFNNPKILFSTYLDRIPDLQNTIADVTTVDNIRNAPWSKSYWGWGFWAGYQDSFVRVNLRAGTVAKSIQVGLQTVGINQTYHLAGFQLEAVPDFRKTIVR